MKTHILDTPRFKLNNPVEDGKIIKLKSGKPKPNTKLRDYERIPHSESIDNYETEVKPHLQNHGWIGQKIR